MWKIDINLLLEEGRMNRKLYILFTFMVLLFGLICFVTAKLVESQPLDKPDHQSDIIEQTSKQNDDREISKIEIKNRWGERIKKLPESGNFQKVYYDKNGIIFKIELFKNNAIFIIHKIIYDENEVVIRKDFISPEGEYLGKLVYVYNDKGNVLKEKRFDKSGNLQKTYEREYKNGKVIEMKQIRPDGTIEMEKLLRDNGKVYKSTYFLEDGTTKIWFFDDEKRCLREEHYKNQKLIGYFDYIYSHSGKLLRIDKYIDNILVAYVLNKAPRGKPPKFKYYKANGRSYKGNVQEFKSF